MTPDATMAVLTIALVVGPGWRPSGWQARLIDRIAADPRLKLAGRLLGTAGGPAPGLPGTARALLGAERALTRLMVPDYPSAAAEARLAGLPDLTAGEGEVDVALALDRFSLPPEQLGRTRRGEWALSFGGLGAGAAPDWLRLSPDPAPDGLIEVEILGRSAAQPVPQVLHRAGYNPKPSSLLNGAFLAEKAALFALKSLRQASQDEAAAGPGDCRPRPPPAPPRTGDALGYGSRLFRKATQRMAGRLRERVGKARDHWHLEAGTGGIDGFDPARAISLPRLCHTMADPFLLEHEGGLYVFYEAAGPRTGPARIDVARLEGDRLEPLGTALCRDYHLSFPFVFRHGGAIYMMPETQQNRRLEVWRASGFPLRWELHATAFEGQHLADSTLLEHEGQWWLFTNLSDHAAFQEHSSELYLFAVDGPDLRHIRPHPLNPVVIGSDVARNAGAVIREGGRLFRPSQINAHGVYGFGLNLMEIERLDATGYRERLHRRFTAAGLPGATGLHHLSMAGGRFVFDRAGR